MGLPTQNIIRKRLINNDLEGAKDHFTNQVIDEISFPYRRGTGASITHGMQGHTLFNLSNWNIHFAHTMGRWVKTGQWDNFVRFIAAGTAAKRSIEEAFNIDATRFTVLRRIANPTLSPTIQLLNNLYQGIIAIKEGNRTRLNAASDTLVKTLKALGRPGGVGLQNWEDFFKSYNSTGQPGVPEGKYRVYTKGGPSKTAEYADFSDILLRAFGFVSGQEFQNREFLNTTGNAVEDLQTQGREKVNELIIEAVNTTDPNTRKDKLNEAAQLIQDFGITGDLGSSLENFMKPQVMRRYEEMPPILKARFGSWYSELIKQQYNVK